jgi:hypothetical protein
MAVATVYFKEDVRAVGMTGGAPVRSVDAHGNVTWTTTTNGATATVKWKDGTIEDQPHANLKVGSKITKLAGGGYEIEEAA